MASSSISYAIMLSDYHTTPLEALIADLYGPKARLGPPETGFYDAVSGARPSAVSWSAFHWFFDMANVMSWYDDCPIKKGPASIFVLDPTRNWYGYAAYLDGAPVARQFGTDQELSGFHRMQVLSAIEHLHYMSPFGVDRSQFKDVKTQQIL